METHPIADRARELVAEGRVNEAESHLYIGLRHNPNQPDLLCELGLVYCFTGRDHLAVKLLDRAFKGLRGDKIRRSWSSICIAESCSISNSAAKTLGLTRCS